MVQSVFQHVTTLEQELGYLPTQEKIAATLVNGFQKSFGVSFNQENLSDVEISLANRLKEEKYGSPEWTFKY
jgi:lipoate-protein ligase A